MDTETQKWAIGLPLDLRRELAKVPGPGWYWSPRIGHPLFTGFPAWADGAVWLPCSELSIVRHAASLAGTEYASIMRSGDAWMAACDDDHRNWLERGPDSLRAAVGLLARVMGVTP